MANINAQVWLDETYPIEKRKDVNKIGDPIGTLSEGIKSVLFPEIDRNLVGKFNNFNGFINLSELNLGELKIDSIILIQIL